MDYILHNYSQSELAYKEFPPTNELKNPDGIDAINPTMLKKIKGTQIQ